VILRNPRVLLSAGAALLGVSSLWLYGRSAVGFDFYQFWAVSQAVAEGTARDVYDDAGRERVGRAFATRALLQPEGSRERVVAGARTVVKTWSTPFLYAAFLPLASGDYERDYTRQQLLALACTVAAVLCFGRRAGLSWPAVLGVLAVLALVFEPLRSDVRVGNVNQLQLGLLALALTLRGEGGGGWRRGLAGFALGLLVAFKPNVAPMVPVLWIVELARGGLRRTVAEAAGLAAGAAAAVGAASLFFGTPACWLAWLRFLRASLYDERAMSLERGNYSLDRLFYEGTGVHVGAAVGLALVAAVALAAWRRRSRGGLLPLSALAAASLGLCLSLLAAPLSFLHYYVLLVPAILHLLRPASTGSRRRVRPRHAAAVGAIVGVATLDLAARMGLPLAGRLETQAVLTCATAAALFAALLAELARGSGRGTVP
jgi:hypothetical protein